MEVILTAIAGVIATIGSSFATWFFSRKKYNSEVDLNVIANMKESLDFYKTLADDYKNRLATEIEGHNLEVAELKKENAELKKELRDQERRFDSRLEEQQKELAMMKNQMLSVYSQVCLNFKCVERVPIKVQDKSHKKTNKIENYESI